MNWLNMRKGEIEKEVQKGREKMKTKVIDKGKNRTQNKK